MRSSIIRVSLALAFSAGVIAAAAGADQSAALQGNHGVQSRCRPGKEPLPAKERILDMGGE